MVFRGREQSCLPRVRETGVRSGKWEITYSLFQQAPHTLGTTLEGSNAGWVFRGSRQDTRWSPRVPGVWGGLCHPGLAVPGKPPPRLGERRGPDWTGKVIPPSHVSLLQSGKAGHAEEGIGKSFTSSCPLSFLRSWTGSTKLLPWCPQEALPLRTGNMIYVRMTLSKSLISSRFRFYFLLAKSISVK